MHDNGSSPQTQTPTPATLPNLAGHQVRDLERQAIRDTLAVTGGNVTRSARLLGLSSRTLQRKISLQQDLFDLAQALRRRHMEQRWHARRASQEATT